jgi:hypothetical protein
MSTAVVLEPERVSKKRRGPDSGSSVERVIFECSHPLYADKKFIAWLEYPEEVLRTMLNRHFRGF